MQQQRARKKIVIMTSISVGIIIFAFLLPLVVIPTLIGVSKANNCLDYNCANDVFTRCGVYQSNSQSSWTDTWSDGMKGMVCMLGFDNSAKVSAGFENPITLNKAWLHIG